MHNNYGRIMFEYKFLSLLFRLFQCCAHASFCVDCWPARGDAMLEEVLLFRSWVAWHWVLQAGTVWACSDSTFPHGSARSIWTQPTAVRSNYFSWASPLMLATLPAIQNMRCGRIYVCKQLYTQGGSRLNRVCVCVSTFYFRLHWVNKAIRLCGLLCSTSSQFIEAIRLFFVSPLLCNHQSVKRVKITFGKMNSINAHPAMIKCLIRLD